MLRIGYGLMMLAGACLVGYAGYHGVRALVTSPAIPSFFKGLILQAALGMIVARRIRYLHPVGLEKSVPVDLNEVAERLLRDADGQGPTLWVVPGDIFTEIEALRVLANVEALPVSAGGIGGAEGAIWLALFGSTKQLDRAQQVLDSVRGEPAFTDA